MLARGLKRLLAAIGAAVAILIAIVIVRTELVRGRRVHVPAVAPIVIDRSAAAQLLSGAVQFKTVSNEDPGQLDRAAFQGLHDYLKQSFPNLHRVLTLESVGQWSLLYTWKGSDPTLPPVLLMAHQDVVPVAPGTEDRWKEPPFSGAIADGYIWGRGAMDDKGSLVGLMAAVEMLVKEGFQPRRTLYLAFGHDEEVAGTGAAAMAALLASRGVHVEYVLDEGGSIVKGLVTGVNAPVALVGVAEKGYASIKLSATGEGGHSSMPPAHTAIGSLSRALYRLERDQMPAHFAGLAQQMLTSLAPAARMPFRAFYANTWLFGPLLASVLARTPSSNAMIRTTTAETIVNGGVKDNVLPTDAWAIVNFRILPGDTVESVAEHVRRTIDDPRVSVTVLPDAHDPSVTSGTDTKGFHIIQETVREVYPKVAVVSPYLVLGATDSRRYQVLTHDIYRFTPMILETRDLERIHGTNERVAVDGFARAVAFYAQLIRNSLR